MPQTCEYTPSSAEYYDKEEGRFREYFNKKANDKWGHVPEAGLKQDTMGLTFRINLWGY